MTARNTWKNFEREVMKRLGGERIPVSGRATDKHAADGETALLDVQCKKGYGIPDYLREWVNGISDSARDRGKLGLVVWQDKGGKVDEALVVLKLRDYRDWHGA